MSQEAANFSMVQEELKNDQFRYLVGPFWLPQKGVELLNGLTGELGHRRLRQTQDIVAKEIPTRGTRGHVPCNARGCYSGTPQPICTGEAVVI